MARPRKSQLTREALIELGMELIAVHGYHGTGLKMILDAAKVPKGSFYNYFSSKEVFVAEIINHYSLHVGERFDAYLEVAEGDPVTILKEGFALVIRELEGSGMKGCLIGNLAAEIGTLSPSCQAAMKAGAQVFCSRVEALMEDAQKMKLLRDDISAAECASLVWSVWEGGLLKAKIDGDTRTLRQHIVIVMDTLLRP